MTIVAHPPALRRPAAVPVEKSLIEERGLVRDVLSALIAPLALLASSLSELLARRAPDDPEVDGLLDRALGRMRRRLRLVSVDPLRDQHERDGRETARRLDLVTDLVPSDALAWAEQRAAELVTEISETTRQALRETIARSIRDRVPREQTIQAIMDTVGLHSRQAAAVARHRLALVEDGVPPARLDRQVEAYRERLLRQRATTIARTELLRASNEGALTAYRRAVDAGSFPTGVVKRWVTARDERLCPTCKPLNHKEVDGVEGEFTVAGVKLKSPPAHPACRCRIVARANEGSR